MIGSTVLHFRIDALAGEGGMGTVYRATDLRLDRPVALKFLRPEYTSSPEARGRFAREARAAARVSHPNIAAVYDFFEYKQQSVIVMEWVEGGSLAGTSFRDPASWSQAVDILRQVAAGLDTAHQAGIIHRDIKPSNILVSTTGLVKVTDFGVAHVGGATTTSRSGVRLVGTPNRIAPEQWQGKEADQSSDIFALGTIAYELVAGRPPFSGESLESLAYQIVSVPHEAPSKHNPALPSAVDAAIGRALAKSPDVRPDCARAFVETLENALLSRDNRPNISTRPKTRKYAIPAALTLLITVLALIGWPSRKQNSGVNPVQQVQAAQPARAVSLVILPVRVASGDEQTAYNATGLGASLTRTFESNSGFAIITLHSVPNGIDAISSYGEIKKTTEGDFALDAELSSKGGRYSLSARVIDLRNGQAPWHQTYEGLDRTDIFRISDRVLADLCRWIGWQPPLNPILDMPSLTSEWIARGQYHLEHNNLEMAEAMFDSAIASAPNRLILRYYLGLVKKKQGDYAAAAREFEFALPDAPSARAIAWDTAGTPRKSVEQSIGVWEGESGKVFTVYYDSSHSRFRYCYLDAKQHLLLEESSSLVEGLPVAQELLSWPRGWRNRSMWAGVFYRDSFTTRIRILDRSGQQTGITYPMTVSPSNRLEFSNGYIMVQRSDSTVLFDARGSRVGSVSEDKKARISNGRPAFSATICSGNYAAFLRDTVFTIYQLVPFRQASRVSAGSGIVDAVVAGDTLVVLTGSNPQLTVYRMSDGQELWRSRVPTAAPDWEIIASLPENEYLLRGGHGVALVKKPNWFSRNGVFLHRKDDSGLAASLQSDSLWITHFNGYTELYSIRARRTIGTTNDGPRWDAAYAWYAQPIASDGIIAFDLDSLESDKIGISFYGGTPIQKLWQVKRSFGSMYHPNKIVPARLQKRIFVTGTSGRVFEIASNTGRVVSERSLFAGSLTWFRDSRVTTDSTGHVFVYSLPDLRAAEVVPTAPIPVVTEAELRLHLWQVCDYLGQKAKAVDNLILATECGFSKYAFLQRDLHQSSSVVNADDTLLWTLNETISSLRELPFAWKHTKQVLKSEFGIELPTDKPIDNSLWPLSSKQSMWRSVLRLGSSVSSGLLDWNSTITVYGDTVCRWSPPPESRPLKRYGLSDLVAWIDFESQESTGDQRVVRSPFPVGIPVKSGVDCRQLCEVGLSIPRDSTNVAIDAFLVDSTYVVASFVTGLSRDTSRATQKLSTSGTTIQTLEFRCYDAVSGEIRGKGTVRGRVTIPIAWRQQTATGTIQGYDNIGLITAGKNFVAGIVNDSLYLLRIPDFAVVGTTLLKYTPVRLEFRGELLFVRSQNGELVTLRPECSESVWRLGGPEMSLFDSSHDTVVVWERNDSAVSAIVLPRRDVGGPRRLWSLSRVRRDGNDLRILGGRVFISSQPPRVEERSSFELTSVNLRNGAVSWVIRLPFPLESFGYDLSRIYGQTNTGLIFRAPLEKLIRTP